MSIVERVEKYDFSKLKFHQNVATNGLKNGFVAEIQLKDYPISGIRKTLVSCPYFTVSAVRLHTEMDREKFTRLEKADEVWTYADKDGFVCLLEITAKFRFPYQDELRETTVDLPLNLFNAIEQPVYAYYDGVRLGWVCENELKNLDFTFGLLAENGAQGIEVFDLARFGVSVDLTKVLIETALERTEKSMNFYSPKYYNAWAGDTMNFYHDGTYHLLFLLDRHHHHSRWGGGAHGVYHLTTKDFINWEEQPPVYPIDEPWKSVGTGTMFFHNGKYYFSHGLHTSRMIPVPQTGSSLIEKQSNPQEKIAPVSYAELKKNGLYPSGANYMVSDDGIHFKAGDCIFHLGENPSVYVAEGGGLFMFGGYGSSGIWRAKSLNGEWVLDEKAEVPQSPLKPSTECPSIFELNGYKYLVMGFTGYWKTDKSGEIYRDEGIDGFDVYDGLAVPMVAKTDDDRLILSGWICGEKWGSVVVHRELMQTGNGRLYMKWLKELAPKKDELTLIANNERKISLNERRSYYFETDICANEQTKTFVRFDGQTHAVLTIDGARKIIQINDSEEEILPFCELVKHGDVATKKQHRYGGNFAIGQVDTIGQSYKLKIVLYYEQKTDSVILDCEIGEKRTLISNRVNERYSKVSFETQNGEIENISAYEL